MLTGGFWAVLSGGYYKVQGLDGSLSNSFVAFRARRFWGCRVEEWFAWEYLYTLLDNYICDLLNNTLG